MRIRVCFLIIAAALIAAFNSCNSAGVNVAGDLRSESNAVAFSLTGASDHSLTPALGICISEDGKDVIVKVELSYESGEAFGAIRFNPERYTPESVEWAESTGEIKIALTGVRGQVPFGAAGVRGAEIAKGALLTVRFGQAPQPGSRIVSTAPSGPGNSVDDLATEVKPDGTVSLTWSERNVGDYDLNGEVGVADITPIALNYLAVLGDGRMYRGVELPGGDISWSGTPIKTVPRTQPGDYKRPEYSASDDPSGGA